MFLLVQLYGTVVKFFELLFVLMVLVRFIGLILVNVY